MYDVDRQAAKRPGAANLDAGVATPGKTSATDGMIAKARPMFAGEATWEDIDPGELELLPAPPVAAQAKVSAASAQRPRRKPAFTPYAASHGKEIRNYRYGKKAPVISNTVGESFGAADTYGGVRDGRISVDIGTVVGGKPKGFERGWVLVFHKAIFKKPGKKAVKKNSGDHTGWVRVGKLPKRAQRDIARRQLELRKELRTGAGPGHTAKPRGKTLTFAIQGSELITDKANPGFIDFRIKGGSASTPLGNYTLRPASYGQIIVGTWNPPGAAAASGKRYGGSGGVRAFLPLTTKLRATTVPAQTIRDTTGKGTSTWVYVEAKVAGSKVFLWVLKDWSITKGGKTATGQNF